MMVNVKLGEEMRKDEINMSQAWDKEESESPTYMTLSTFLILAVRGTHVIHETSIWPGSMPR